MAGEIKFIDRAAESTEVRKILHPVVEEWFFGKYKDFSLTQLYGVPVIWSRKNIFSLDEKYPRLEHLPPDYLGHSHSGEILR